MDLSKIFLMNPFSKFFRAARVSTGEERKENEEILNSQGASQEEIDFGRFANYEGLEGLGSGGLTYIGIQFEQFFANKAARIGKYREMSLYPEISDALDQICDEAIQENDTGEIVSLEIKKEMPEHIEEEVRKQWKYILNDVFSFNARAWDLFRKWLVDDELYVEVISDKNGDNIIGIKILAPQTVMPIYVENTIKGFMQTSLPKKDVNEVASSSVENATVMFDKDQIAYSNYGLYGQNFLDVRGFLESTIRVYNQLRNLEDSLVIYRLVRAPERRVWNINVGKMPKGKAEEYIKGLIQKYKKRIIYDTNTGAMNSAQNVQALTEDFWFAKNENGEGTSVDTIGGGMNLGELDDVNYFLQKMYKTLKLPRSRWEDPANSVYSSGKSGEVVREEIKFSNFVGRLQNRFKYILIDPFLTQLRMQGIDPMYINDSIYNVSFTRSNLYREYKEMELTESRFALLTTMNDFVFSDENPQGYFSKEFILKKYFLMSDEEWDENLNDLRKEKLQASEAKAEGGEEGFGGEEEGGEEGGGEFGGGGEEAPAEGEAAPEKPTTPEEELPVAPESTNIEFGKESDDDTEIFKNWMKDDKTIQNKKRDNSLLSKGDKII